MEADIIDELAVLASKHKLVPFIGSGCSIDQTGHDWDSIRDKLTAFLDTEAIDHLEVAQEFVDKYGRDRLCEFLKDLLMIDSFNDERGISLIAIISLGLGVIYTTNQDNVMEKCLEVYGRDYSVIIKLEDLEEYTPGNRLFIKFHGDITQCDSIIFTTDDYRERIEDDKNFLNIRLQADLLAKNLLFIGYSLRDINIKLILKEFRSVFGEKLPKSYLIAWEYSDELKHLCEEHGIRIIVPMEIFPDSPNNSVAFDRFLSKLTERTLVLKSEKELDDLIRPTTPPTRRVINKFEIDSLEYIINNKNFTEGCNAFRAILDQSTIPRSFEPLVVDMFEKLAIKCSNSTESNDLSNAAFNLIFSNPKNYLYILTSLMATANVRNSEGIFDRLHISMPNLSHEIYIVPAAVAIEKLDSWDRTINDGFRQHVNEWVDNSLDFNQLPKEHQEYVKKWFDKAWSTHTIYEHPLKRQKRLKEIGYVTKARPAAEIVSRMLDSMPKTFGKPYED